MLIPDEDWFEEVLSDSLDMDWTMRDGARAIVRALAKLNAPRGDAEEAAQPRCGCTPEIARRVIVDHGTCGMGGCPYGGDV